MDFPAFTMTDILLIALLWVTLVHLFLEAFSKGRSRKITQTKEPTQPGFIPVQVQHGRFQFRRTEKEIRDPFYLNQEYMETNAPPQPPTQSPIQEANRKPPVQELYRIKD